MWNCLIAQLNAGNLGFAFPACFLDSRAREHCGLHWPEHSGHQEKKPELLSNSFTASVVLNSIHKSS